MQRCCNIVCYFYAMKFKLFFTLFVGLSTFTVLQAQIRGIVMDDFKEPLPGATLILLPDSIVSSSQLDGRFQFTGLDSGVYTIAVSYIGYEDLQLKVKLTDERFKPVKIYLTPHEELLETIVVTEEHAKQEMSLTADHFTHTLLEENRQGTFAESIEKLPGISAINVGVGIAKPVIRGLSSNRIIVNQQGIKQESHQWGADHGLEVDQYDVERVEIIKGPASLQYGSDGLGGVINIMPGRIIPENSFAGSVEGVHKTNNEHWGGSALLAFNHNNFFVSGRYSRQSFGDYRVPADQFIYNSFVLPIYNRQLKNTAGEEENVRVSAGLQRSWGVTRIHFGHYSLDAGLFAGAVGIPRSYALTDDGNSRDIDVPKQSVDHYRLSLHQSIFIGEDHLDFNLGYQRNLRREFSFPEFHSIPSSQIELDNTLALQFELQTWSANLHYEKQLNEGRKMVVGGNVQWQDNRRAGFEFLLPNFKTFRSGVFALSEWEISPDWSVNGGLRVDYASNDTEFFRQWVWDSNENITDSLVVPQTELLYYNWSASVGSSWRVKGDQWIVKANLGKSFRVPYPAEMVSNGIHHGTFRHEVGSPNLDSEQGYQLDISTEWYTPSFSGSFATYVNYFDNYIYLGPTFPAQFSPLPEAGQIFRYRQDDAIYTGFEFQWNWEILPGLRLQETADFVQSYNINTKLALPFTPQPALKHSLRYTLTDKKIVEQAFLEIGYDYFFAAEGQYRVDRSEQPTPAYQLWNIGAGLELRLGQQNIQFNLQVQNALDEQYLNHLSRYRIINVAEQGRNVVLSLKVPFEGKLKKPFK
jgi:iron complex outermembrane receptor protein